MVSIRTLKMSNKESFGDLWPFWRERALQIPSYIKESLSLNFNDVCGVCTPLLLRL